MTTTPTTHPSDAEYFAPVLATIAHIAKHGGKLTFEHSWMNPAEHDIEGFFLTYKSPDGAIVDTSEVESTLDEVLVNFKREIEQAGIVHPVTADATQQQSSAKNLPPIGMKVLISNGGNGQWLEAERVEYDLRWRWSTPFGNKWAEEFNCWIPYPQPLAITKTDRCETRTPVGVPFIRAPRVYALLLATHNYAPAFNRIKLVARMSTLGEVHNYLSCNGVAEDKNLLLDVYPDTQRLRITFPQKEDSWIEVPLSAFDVLIHLARQVYGEDYAIGYTEVNPALAKKQEQATP